MHWIVGDIHGMLKPLEALLELIRRLDAAPSLCFVGDFVNRGPDAKAVIDLLLTLDNARFVRGNHDDIFDQVLHGKSFARNPTFGDRLAGFQWFMQHGLMTTLISYGADYAELDYLQQHPSLPRVEKLLAMVPESHRRFIRNLPAIIEDEGFFVGHGKWGPDDPSEGPPPSVRLDFDPVRRERLLWGRFESAEIRRNKAWRRTGYFGHTPVDNYPDLLPSEEFVPIVGPGIVLLDTACALSPQGRLTAVCHETQTFHQADRFGNIITA